MVPSLAPTSKPSCMPSGLPINTPSDTPSAFPNAVTSESPSVASSHFPTLEPSSKPSWDPVYPPSDTPSDTPLSPIPSTTPSDSPNSKASSAPSTNSSFFQCSRLVFIPIANDTDAELLSISNSYRDTQLVNLGFNFCWLGGESMTSDVRVSTNDQININSNDCSVARNEVLIGAYSTPRITVAQENLNPRKIDGGGIWTKRTSSDSMLISWENVKYSGRGKSFINAQALMFGSGRVAICYDKGKNIERYDHIAAGIEGGVNDHLFPNGPAVAYPVTTSDFLYPHPPPGTCYCFDPILVGGGFFE